VERVAVAIDARNGQVATHGWQASVDLTTLALAKVMRLRGVYYVVYTDILRDGMLQGVDVEAAVSLAWSTGLRIIASGGVASLEEMVRLRRYAGVGIEGVIVGRALYCGALSLPEVVQTAGG
jgi:phosphoribosylformimino-5-aminoimidazole carboxamide ribotide isomerase